jgi:hypothetical protein
MMATRVIEVLSLRYGNGDIGLMESMLLDAGTAYKQHDQCVQLAYHFSHAIACENEPGSHDGHGGVGRRQPSRKKGEAP